MTNKIYLPNSYHTTTRECQVTSQTGWTAGPLGNLSMCPTKTAPIEECLLKQRSIISLVQEMIHLTAKHTWKNQCSNPALQTQYLQACLAWKRCTYHSSPTIHWTCKELAQALHPNFPGEGGLFSGSIQVSSILMIPVIPIVKSSNLKNGFCYLKFTGQVLGMTLMNEKWQLLKKRPLGTSWGWAGGWQVQPQQRHALCKHGEESLRRRKASSDSWWTPSQTGTWSRFRSARSHPCLYNR